MNLRKISEIIRKQANSIIRMSGDEIHFIENDGMYMNVQLTEDSEYIGLTGTSSERNQMEDDLQNARIIEWDEVHEKLKVDGKDWSHHLAYS